MALLWFELVSYLSETSDLWPHAFGRVVFLSDLECCWKSLLCNASITQTYQNETLKKAEDIKETRFKAQTHKQLQVIESFC